MSESQTKAGNQECFEKLGKLKKLEKLGKLEKLSLSLLSLLSLLSQLSLLSLSHSLSLNMLNFCFHVYAQKSLFIAENCNGFF